MRAPHRVGWFVRALGRSAWNTILRSLRGGEIGFFFLPVLLVLPMAVLSALLGGSGKEGAVVVALPEQDPPGLWLQEAFEAEAIEPLRLADPRAALDDGRALAAVRAWDLPADPDAVWTVSVEIDRHVVREPLRLALQEAHDLALAESILDAGGSIAQDLRVLDVTRSPLKGRPRMKILLGSLLLLSGLASSLLLSRDLTQDREQGGLEATFVTRGSAVADLAGRAVGFCALMMWSPIVLLFALGIFRGLILRMGYQPVYLLQLASAIFVLCVLGLVPGVVARSAPAAVPWSIGVLWTSLGLALGSIVLAAPGWPIVGTGTPAPLGLQLLTVLGNLGLGIGGLIGFGWWIEGAWALPAGSSR